MGLHYYYCCFEALGVSVSDADAFVGAYERKERSPLQPVEEGGFYARTVGVVGTKTSSVSGGGGVTRCR